MESERREIKMEYFQVRKNSRQVLRIYRGPFEGLDITRIQLWYRGPEDNDYKPGRVVAFASELIPGIIEGLVKMSIRLPIIEVGVCGVGELSQSPPELVPTLQRILKAHKTALHWENLSTILHEEKPNIRVSNWAVYNALLGNPDIFSQVDEDVFAMW